MLLNHGVCIDYIGSFRCPANRDHACHLMVEQPLQRATLVSDTCLTVKNCAHDADPCANHISHCMFGEFWAMPILIAMNTLPDGGREWARFSMVTLIAGCESTRRNRIQGSKLILYFTYYRPLLPPHPYEYHLGEQFLDETSFDADYRLQRRRPDRLGCELADLPQGR
jgi:hypothetical protein